MKVLVYVAFSMLIAGLTAPLYAQYSYPPPSVWVATIVIGVVTIMLLTGD